MIVGTISDGLKKVPVFWTSPTSLPTRLPVPLGVNGFAEGINNLGQIVGSILKGNVEVPVFWASPTSQPTELSLGGLGIIGEALGINNLGQIVGFVSDVFALDFTPLFWSTPTSQPTLLTGEGNASDINDLGNIVGLGYDITQYIPQFWSSPTSEPTLLPGDITGSATGINNAGQIVGYKENTTGTLLEPLFWADSTSQPIPLPGKGVANGINTLGQIVGSSNELPLFWASRTVEPIPLPLGDIGTSGGANGINDSTPAPTPTPTPSPSVLIVKHSGAEAYIINGFINPSLTLVEGETYTFQLAVSGHPFWIKTQAVTGTGSAYNKGVTNNGSVTGSLTFTVPYDAPAMLYYICQVHSAMQGVIYIRNAPTPIPTSNICFPAGTPIQTDQGVIAIEKLDKTVHTLRGQPILHVTQTVTLDKYLIAFAPHSIGRHIPTARTIMTKDHQIEFDGRLAPAERFLQHSREIKKVKYTGEILYNVLLPTHSRMSVNGLVCETLHPENIIAKLYTKRYSETERNEMIRELNESLHSKNFKQYKKVVNRLTE